MKRKAAGIAVIILSAVMMLTACATTSHRTVELSLVTGEQIVQLQNSHIRFVQGYYDRLREDVTRFMEEQWIPVFLSKAVQNRKFREDLDAAYLIAGIEARDVKVEWKGKALPEPQKSAVLSGIEQAVIDHRGRLGQVLLEFARAAQVQINQKRKELLDPVEGQERMVISEINAAYAELQGAQAAVRGHLESVAAVKENQDLVMKKIGLLEKRDRTMKTLLDADEEMSRLLQKKQDAEKAFETIKNKIIEMEDMLKGDKQ